MKPVLRVVEGKSEVIPEQEFPAAGGAYPLPPEMEGRADAAELRAFMLNFQRIENPDDRRQIVDAVRRAAQGET